MPDPCVISSPRVALSLVYSGSTAQLTSDLIPSPQPGNAVQLLDDGLFVSQAAIPVVQSLPAGAQDGTLRILQLTPAVANQVYWLCIRDANAAAWRVVGAPVAVSDASDLQFNSPGDSSWHQFSTPTINVPAKGVYHCSWNGRLTSGNLVPNIPSVGVTNCTLRVGLSINGNDPASDRWGTGFIIGNMAGEAVVSLNAADTLRLKGSDTANSGQCTSDVRQMTLTPLYLPD